jgi:predicted esterase
MLAGFIGESERHGVALVAPASKAATWDMIVEMVAARRRPISRPFRPSLAVDLPRIEAALAAMAARVPLDARRVALAGFSDGASYALTVGTMNPGTFSAILAFSPGIGLVAPSLSPAQRLFIAHGTADPVLPYAGTAERIAAPLQTRVDLRFRPFTGGHSMPPDVREEAFRFFLAKPPT